MRLIILFLFFSYNCFAQFAPTVGQSGTSAIEASSSVFVNWANACIVTRGYANISNTSSGYASAGSESSACGKALENGTVSLGDGGYAILTFPYGIKNGSGADFAVFENSFNDDFLELAFVEVSSDGVKYFRFPATSNTQISTQVGTFGLLDATKLNNLAGKYRGGYGTPFDLEELKDSVGLDVNKITHVKVIDVVGSIDSNYGFKDVNNNAINDPFPTEFPSGGFDLDALGVINQNTILGFKADFFASKFLVFPNPASSNDGIFIQSILLNNTTINVYNLLGNIVLQLEINSADLQKIILPKGIYFIECITDNNFIEIKKVVIHD